MDLAGLGASLREAASDANHRRLVVITGTPATTLSTAEVVLDGAAIEQASTTYCGHRTAHPWEQLPLGEAHQLLGQSRSGVVLDCHRETRPNAIGQVSGVVEGGGLLCLLVPPFEQWLTRQDGFDETMIVPPFPGMGHESRFRRRIVRTLRQHEGIAIIDTESGEIHHTPVETTPPSFESRGSGTPSTSEVPDEILQATKTADQRRALEALEALIEQPAVGCLTAHRGRGKSATAGLFASVLLERGQNITVTGPRFSAVQEVFERARATLETRGMLETASLDRSPRHITATSGATLEYHSPQAIKDDIETTGGPEILIVDEAAGLAVDMLKAFLRVDRGLFLSTVHGYEGAGRGFSIRFEAALQSINRPVIRPQLEVPIRYAANDPIERWAFHALLLDASPPPASVVEGATATDCSFRSLPQSTLAAPEHRLRSVFGLLVLAHYRTEPDDLARVLDAPNLSIHVATVEGHVVGVAVLAREGDLEAATVRSIQEGDSVRGNMIPELLEAQLRDVGASRLRGGRIWRIAVHPAVHGNGIGSALLEYMNERVGGQLDWLGAGFGATDELIQFWGNNGYSPIHMGTSRNEASGEYSTIVLQATSPLGRYLQARHTRWLSRRLPALLADPLADLDPAVVEALYHQLAPPTQNALPTLEEDEWRFLEAIGSGTAHFDTDPGPAKKIVRWALEASPRVGLSRKQRQILVQKVLQGHPWEWVASRNGIHSRRLVRRQVADSIGTILEACPGEQL